MRTPWQLATILPALLSLAACPTKPGVGESSTTLVLDDEGTDADEIDDSGDEATDESGTTTGGTEFERVSILLVLDNSGSMGETQARVVPAVQAMIGVLDAAAIDWRLGVTTSDNGNPWCPAGSTTPEGGKLVMSSCKNRLGDFLFSDSVDVQDLACNDVCPLGSFEVLPTTTEVEAFEIPRPWLERMGGQANVDQPVEDVIACFVPQGVNGCGFESQLESGYLAVARASNSDEESYGFVTDDRLLVVIQVTDEEDCSYNPEWADIFAQDGNKEFWSDPSSAYPTSAVCWNAGVRCTGDPGQYDSCDPVNKGIDGAAGVDDADAVLRPVSRYVDQLSGFEALVFGIVGVGDDGQPFYADTPDLGYQESFGIGPGCIGPGGQMPVPPVRARVVVEASGQRLYSICDDNLQPAFTDIGQRIVDRL